MATNARGRGWLTQAVTAEIRAQLGYRKWKQIDLSRATGIHKATISSILADKSALDLNQLAEIAEALNMDPSEITDAAERRAREKDSVYRADGTLDPAGTKGVPESDEHIEALERRTDSTE